MAVPKRNVNAVMLGVGAVFDFLVKRCREPSTYARREQEKAEKTGGNRGKPAACTSGLGL
jgi:hypothetical protein